MTRKVSFAVRSRSMAIAMIVGITSVVIPLAAQRAAAATLNVSYTLEGCNLDHGGTYDELNVVCSDSAYTTGNLGKSWAELDLVPFRVTLDNSTSKSSATGQFAVAGDYKNTAGTATGWDLISVLTLNTANSSASGCPAVTSGPQTITPSGAGVGGADQTIYRLITATIPAGKTCVYDYYMRLALGAHLFSGSSLQGNLWNENLESGGVGEKRVSIPVNEIAPQELTKDMSATQDQTQQWSLTKGPTPITMDFGDTCAGGTGPFTRTVDITVTWTKGGVVPAGTISITTHVYANNPAHRVITVQATDVIHGSGGFSDSFTGAAVDVPANTSLLVLTHTTLAPAGTTDLYDVATATYTDKLTGQTVPGTTSVRFPASGFITVGAGTTTNGTADISDSESITGTGLDFKVGAPSVGAFTGGYVADTYTTGPVGWALTGQTTSGSITFHKTVRLDQPRNTTGTLSDTATLNAGTFTTTASAVVNISSSATASLKIEKTIQDVLGAGDADQVFHFTVSHGASIVDATPSITFTTGDGGASDVHSTTVTGLTPGVTYTVSETTLAPYAPQDPQTATITLPSCSATVHFDNTHGPANAQVKKVTVPAGNEAGWVFDLHSGTASGPIIDTATTTDNGFILFTGPGATLAEGTYTITEQPKTGFDQTGSTGCTFTVNYPADADRTFSCTITNTQRGQINLVKLFQGVTPTGTQTFSFDLRTGASAGVAGTIVEAVTLSSSNSWSHNFTLLVPGTYQLCENGIPPGGHSSLEADPNHFSPGIDNSTVCIPVVVGAGQTVTITVDNTPPPGGNARTIGFWKNWTSCDGKGNQAPVLDQTLYKAGAGGITIGTLTLHGGLTANSSPDCLKAIRILNKTTIDGLTKKASDPLFNMAAQLLAAKLNIVAGAASCPAANTAIAQAQALLVKYGWNGLTYSPALTPADKTLANQLNGILDSYNNNTLC